MITKCEKRDLKYRTISSYFGEVLLWKTPVPSNPIGIEQLFLFSSGQIVGRKTVWKCATSKVLFTDSRNIQISSIASRSQPPRFLNSFRTDSGSSRPSSRDLIRAFEDGSRETCENCRSTWTDTEINFIDWRF